MASIEESNSLFEIDQELDALLEEIQKDVEAKGEASEELIERFQSFCTAHGKKIDRIGRFVQTMEARTSYCRAEAQRLQERARSAENKGARTKAMVFYYLKSRDLKRLEGMEFTLQLWSNAQASVRILNEQHVPMEYKTVSVKLTGDVWETVLSCVPEELGKRLSSAVKEVLPDTEAIRQARARGEEVPGAEVKRGQHLRIM